MGTASRRPAKMNYVAVQPPREMLGVDTENARGNLHFLSARKVGAALRQTWWARAARASGARWPPLQWTWPAPG